MRSKRTRERAPQVGDGATVLLWTDRRACTVVAVWRDHVTLREDVAVRVDGGHVNSAQSYRYQPDEDGHVYDFRLLDGEWRAGFHRVRFGVRDHYHDYSV